MKKVVYIAAIEMHKSDGVCGKVLSQVKALGLLGFDVTFCHLHKDGYVVINNGIEKYHPLKSRYLFFYDLITSLDNKYFDLLYVRNPSNFHYPSFYFLANRIKGKKLLELPTYPLEKESSFIKRILGGLFFLSSWHFLKKYIDKICYMGEGGNVIWGVPSIEVSNGIDVGSIPINPRNDYKRIDIIAVARMEYWHGYDRIIRSLGQCSKKSNVHLHIVGDNQPCLSKLQELTVSLGLEKLVTFHGALHGKELSNLFSKCNLAVDALGRHRAGHKYNSSIKSKEYTARGIPFIKSHLDKDFYDADFVFNVSPDEHVFDLDEIINWLKDRDFEPEYIRYFSQEKLSWTKKMNFIFEVL